MVLDLFKKPRDLKGGIIRILEEKNKKELFVPENHYSTPSVSSVLFLLGNYSQNGNSPEPSIVLNKRSKKVRQPGDLCFPGGGIAPRLDYQLSKIMAFPGLPLSGWPYWSSWKKQRPEEARWLSLMMAICLRESFEEIRLNPMGVKFLGPLPSHRLRMFKQEIYPMVGWGSFQKRFFPNREVDKIVIVPLRLFLNPDNYVRFRISYPRRVKKKLNRDFEDFPCFIFKNQKGKEILWGVTFRIVMAFISLISDFKVPDIDSLQVVSGVLRDNYLGDS
jgi:8-oxo-dGTP pyrophosphatase MutT (NUDIX family)